MGGKEMKIVKFLIINLFILSITIFLAGCGENTPPVGGGDPDEYTMEEAIDYVNKLFPTYVIEDIELPTTIEGTTTTITWSSNREELINREGKVTRGYEFETVRLTARIRLNGKTETVRNEVTVIPMESPLPKNKKLVFAYNYVGGQGFDQIPAHKIDVMNYAFAYLKNGKIDFSTIRHAEQIIRLRERGTKVVISLGGGGSSGGFSQAVSTTNGRKALIDSIIEGVKKYHFSGVDVDWEYPGSGPDALPNDKENFTLFLTELKAELVKVDPNLLLTAALGIDPTIVKNLDVPAISQVLDYAHLMTYDFVTANTENEQHLTNLYSSPMQGNYSVQNAVNHYNSLGMPLEKIVIGATFYGRQRSFYSDGTKSTYTSISYTEIKEKYLSNPDLITYYFDEAAKAPYLRNDNLFITFDDPRSIKAKCEFVKARDLAGIMFWQYNQDQTGELLDTIYINIR